MRSGARRSGGGEVPSRSTTRISDPVPGPTRTAATKQTANTSFEGCLSTISSTNCQCQIKIVLGQDQRLLASLGTQLPAEAHAPQQIAQRLVLRHLGRCDQRGQDDPSPPAVDDVLV